MTDREIDQMIEGAWLRIGSPLSGESPTGYARRLAEAIRHALVVASRPILLIAVLALCLCSTVPARAATWPANCHTWTCVNRHLNALHAAQLAEQQRAAQMFTCLFSLPAEWVSQTTQPYLALADPASPGQPGTYAFVQLDPACTL